MILFTFAAAFAPLLGYAFPTGCDITNAQLALPPNQTALTAPSSPPLYVTAAFGVQNYTCNTTSQTYASIGAVAELLDISCLYGTPEFANVQNDFYTTWSSVPSAITIQDVISLLGNNPIVLGQHYFVTNPQGPNLPVVPEWDFTASVHKIAIGARVGSLKAPTGPADIDWLQLNVVSGTLAKTIYRVDTKGGQPPASCGNGSPSLSVKYAAKYWFF